MSAHSHLPRRWIGPDGPTPLLEAMSGVLVTPPAPPDATGPLLYAAIGTQQIPAYLLVAKAMRHAIGRGRFAVLDDGTLTGEDRALLAHHCGDPEILVGRADNAPFPTKLAWQGLAALLGRHEADYRVLLDLTRITVSLPDEVLSAIGRNRGFAGPGKHGALGIPAMGANLHDAAILLPRVPPDIHKQPEGARYLAAMLVDQGTAVGASEEPFDNELTPETASEAIAVLLA